MEFELFGYDFIIDEQLKVWLLEVNNNPYIGTPNQFIAGIMPNMIDEMMEIIIDSTFPPEDYQPVEQRHFELIYKEPSAFRISPIRVISHSTEVQSRKEKSLSHKKSLVN